MYTLDTNAIIYYIKGESRAAAILEDIIGGDYPVYISVLTEAELFGYSHLTEVEAGAIDGLLRTTSIIPFDSQLARLAGMIRRTYSTKLSDSVIAATALLTDSTLITRNIKDFKKIPNLTIKHI